MATIAITPAQDEVLGEVFIAAPPARVFEAITDPAQVPRWWGQQGMYRINGVGKADVTSGQGQWSEHRPDDGRWSPRSAWMASISRSIHRGCWCTPGSPVGRGKLETVVRWELEPTDVHGLHPSGPKRAGTGTMLKIRQTGFAGAPEAAKGHAQGWTRVLGWMQAYVEQEATVDSRGATSK